VLAIGIQHFTLRARVAFDGFAARLAFAARAALLAG
jgi:hypothetical protein